MGKSSVNHNIKSNSSTSEQRRFEGTHARHGYNFWVDDVHLVSVNTKKKRKCYAYLVKL